MVIRHSRRALLQATELTLAGDDDGAATWHRIMEAVTQLANTTPGIGALTANGAPGRPYRILNNYGRHFDEGITERVVDDLCPYAIDAARRSRSLANDLDQAGDIDRRRHFVLVAGKPRRLTPAFWRLFTFLYRHRGDVVDNDRIQAELYNITEQPLAANAGRENVRRLRKALAGSRYEIINHPTFGYELIVADVAGSSMRRARRYRYRKNSA